MPVPSDSALEKELRVEARSLLDSGIEVTVNKVRTRVEEKLDLPDQFFKETPEWKDRSKQIIHSAIVRFNHPASGRLPGLGGVHRLTIP